MEEDPSAVGTHDCATLERLADRSYIHACTHVHGDHGIQSRMNMLSQCMMCMRGFASVKQDGERSAIYESLVWTLSKGSYSRKEH